MGWMALIDADDNGIGVVGDSVWDIMGDAIDKITEEYQKDWKRKPTLDELESIFEFSANWRYDVETLG